MRSFHVALTVLTLLCVTTTALGAGDRQIAGTQPDQRPSDAPMITSVDHPGAWYRSALHGVTRPYPYSLRFLEDQGNWHTPFNRPGMPGRYDIRGWHQR
jgi:hypothetical protein